MSHEKIIYLKRLVLTEPEVSPIKCNLSLRPVIEFLENTTGTGVSSVDTVNRTLAGEARSIPELLESPIKEDTLEKHADIIKAIMSAVFPVNFGNTVSFAAIAPFRPVGFLASARFGQTFLGNDGKFLGEPHSGSSHEKNAMMRGMVHVILSKGYGVELPEGATTEIFNVKDQDTGLQTFHQFNIDVTFCRPIIAPECAVLDERTRADLLAHLDNPLYCLKKLPIHGISLEGLAIIRTFDMTDHVAMGLLKEKVLAVTPESLSEIILASEQLMKILCRDQDSKILLTVRRNGGWVRMRGKLLNNPYICDGTELIGDEFFANSIYERAASAGGLLQECLASNPKPVPFELEYRERGESTILVCPLKSGETQTGFLEVVTPRRIFAHGYSLDTIREAQSLFAIAIQRTLDAVNARVESIIKTNCTAIHPSIEWRFRDAAFQTLSKGGNGQGDMPQILFDHVFPLYATCDIRGSSAQRARAIQSDLSLNLVFIRDILTAALTRKDITGLRFLTHRIEQALSSLTATMDAGVELSVFHFIRDALEPAIDMIATVLPDLKDEIGTYRQMVDNNHQSIYAARKSFDESVETLNRELARHLDARQLAAQSVFPHYFEKHVTDGIDHSIYIGSSISNSIQFSKIHLRNLRIWQVETMCELARVADSLRSKLAVPIETAQLIVAQDSPLTVAFRYDERRFDVYGAYNIRYELMKKRIDKARIKGSGERLTIPRSVAVVYSQESERREYAEYFDYLGHRGVVNGAAESLMIEDLQDVSGLRALRATLTPQYLAGDIQIDGQYTDLKKSA